MKGNHNDLSPNVLRLRTSRPRPPSTAAILTGLQLIEAFLKIGNDADRKKVLDSTCARRCRRKTMNASGMRRALALLLIAALAGPALAQDRPKTLKTVRIREPAPGMDTLYAIDEDGTVRIDWQLAEALAATKADRTALPIAQLMLAIRDGTWKPAR